MKRQKKNWWQWIRHGEIRGNTGVYFCITDTTQQARTCLPAPMRPSPHSVCRSGLQEPPRGCPLPGVSLSRLYPRHLQRGLGGWLDRNPPPACSVAVVDDTVPSNTGFSAGLQGTGQLASFRTRTARKDGRGSQQMGVFGSGTGSLSLCSLSRRATSSSLP